MCGNKDGKTPAALHHKLRRDFPLEGVWGVCCADHFSVWEIESKRRWECNINQVASMIVFQKRKGALYR